MSTNDGRPTVGVAGGSGYTGLELLRILARHDGVRVAFATARGDAGCESPVVGLAFADLGPDRVADVDLAFLCLPHGAALPWVQAARDAGVRVVDLTADHRPGSGREAGAVYGMTELTEAHLPDAGLVANPGCYPTGVILALAPLQAAGVIDDARPVVIQAASGVTGAGRSPRRDLLFAEVVGDFRPYALGNGHRHLLEMRAMLPDLQLLFTPHLLPVARGIVETIALPVRGGVDAAEVRATWRERYASSPCVRVDDDGEVPRLARVAGTDEVHLAVFDNEALEAPTLTLVAALDNLGKGAAGQAVQNMNLMLGFDAGRALRCGQR
jgi:N-acetyl-gamma-glutamyl-phosphate reductase